MKPRPIHKMKLSEFAEHIKTMPLREYYARPYLYIFDYTSYEDELKLLEVEYKYKGYLAKVTSFYLEAILDHYRKMLPPLLFYPAIWVIKNG